MVALSRTACLFSNLWLLVSLSISTPLSTGLSLTSAEQTNLNGTCHFNVSLNTTDIADQPYVNLVKNVQIPSGTIYRYVFSPPFESDKPWLLFLHGFPESSYDWIHQIVHFTDLGYGVIVPDLLGYGGTDNPPDLRAFSYHNMVEELRQLLECEGVEKIIGIGHDFGVLLMSRLIQYHPERVSAAAFLGTGYFPPQANLDAASIDVINSQTRVGFGYNMFGYWPWNDRDDSAALVDQNLESWATLTFTSNASAFLENFAKDGATEWLVQNRTTTEVYRSRRSIEQWKRITIAQGGLSGPMKWYKSWMRGMNDPDRPALLTMSGAVSQPTMIILAEQDPIGPPSLQLNNTVPFAPNLRIRSIDSGHFIQLERPVEVNAHLEGFLRDVLRPSQRVISVALSFSACLPPSP